MANYEIVGPFIISMMVGLSALCIFVWAVMSGAFFGSDQAALNFFRTEMNNDRDTRQNGR